MVIEVEPGIFRIEVPLPGNPLRSVNSYVITGSKRNMIIDTAMNREECRTVLENGIDEIGLDLSRTDIFLTHYHADHMGLAPYFASDSSRIYMSREDAAVISKKDHWIKMTRYAFCNGFPAVDPQEAIKKHPGYRYGPLGEMNITHIADGGRLKVGDHQFICVLVPGHTEGHICLFEPERRILFSGDHILGDITPNISLWSGEGDPLRDYLNNLDRVAGMDIDLAYPGHRTPIKDVRGRALELRTHHEMRLSEVERILEDGKMSAFDVASEMAWDLTYDSFEQFPIMQKWFALGEAIAHLRYLKNCGRAAEAVVSGQTMYCL